MKFIKKAAALLFCLTLVFSVMAISASAEEVQLLSATQDSDITLSLVDTSTGTNVNGTNGKEYTSDTSGTAAIQLAYTGSGTAPFVNAFEFTLSIGSASGAATVTLDETNPVVGSTAFSISEVNGSKYTFSTNGAAGVELRSDATTVVTISFTVSGDAGTTNTITVSDFKLFNTGAENGEATTPASDTATIDVEVDPQYSVTIKNPSVTSAGIIDATPNYNTVISSNTYRILAGKNASTTEATLAHYDFAGYVVDTTSSTGKWKTLTGDDLNIANATALDALLDDHNHWGNLVLNAQYTPEKFTLTVKKATPQSNGTIDTSNYGYVTTGVTQYQYDITGAVFAANGTTSATLSAETVAVPYYEFKEFVPVASVSGAGNWTASETQVPGNSYTFPTGKWGNVEFDATYTPIVYTITINQPPVDSHSIITGGSSVAFATPQSVTYTVEGKENATSSENATLPTDLTKTAYTFDNTYKVETDADTGWGDTGTEITTIGVGRHGNVTLVAQFTATQYTVTYDLVGGAFEGTYNNATAVAPTSATTSTYTEGSFKYTIEDTDDGGSAFTFGAPVKTGYNFKGWTATQEGNGEYSTFPSASTEADYVGVYGDVKLTANWEIEGKFVTTDYWYARQDDTPGSAVNNMLILFAVPSKAVPGSGAYKCGDEAMFTTTKYADAFSNLDSGIKYTIFAYIADSSTTISAISYDANAKANEAISYEGDVTDDGEKDPADYGNVVAMLAGRAYNNTALSVKARLEADASDAAKDASEVGGYYGTIADVRAIMDAALGNS